MSNELHTTELRYLGVYIAWSLSSSAMLPSALGHARSRCPGFDGDWLEVDNERGDAPDTERRSVVVNN